MNTIVLGQPYAGALLGFFSDQIGKESTHTRLKNHPYYQALYGPNYRSLIDISITFLLLYDEVWLCPADTFWPHPRTERSNAGYIHELALNANWERFHAMKEHGDPWLTIFRQDQGVMKILQNTGYAFEAWNSVVASAMFEMAVAKNENCAILCSSQHRMLIERMLAI
ncbi:hypothetical protein [Variovorax sp. GB1P17]|uniref:hypothetical protein n=1 Tax=Variovorax sp. GB1P17 TaxID=3443740 RepID=UPI003F474B85